MPAWAQDDPHAYWQAADAHERANGRLYSEVQFALPRELDASGRRELAGAFAERVCGGERLPSTLALHKGEAETPDKPDNPHAHLMFSERGNDGIARSEEQWFKRHNPTAPERGGARKSRAAKAGDWLDKTRQAWEQTANRALEQAGRAERIDGRSLPDRRDAAHREGDLERAAELSREPNVHRGPGQYLKDRGRASATVAQAEAVEQRTATARAERDADRREVERLEREIAAVGARLQEPSNTRRSRKSGPGRSRAWKSKCDGWPSSTHRSRKRTSSVRWTPSFGPKSGLAKVEPAGSVLVVVVSCELGCRPGPGTRNGPTPVRGDGVQVAAGAPRSGVGAERRTWRRSSTPAPGAEAARALMRRGTSTSSHRTRPASDSPTTYAVARHCRSGSSARFPRAPRSANHRGAGRSPHT